MKFERFFRSISYAAVFCGFFSLWISGNFGFVGSGLFLTVLVAAWFLEGTRWQITEKVGTVLIVLSLPVYYLATRFQVITLSGSGMDVAAILGRLILTLTGIKLLQRKSDRDWIFLYLMAFFEVLLAAGLSISALYLVSFILYLLVMVCAIIAFEVRKASRSVTERSTSLLKKTDQAIQAEGLSFARRLPVVAAALIAVIVILALPLFFFLPRVGGAGFGGGGTGISTRSGFSDTVKLGGIGRIQQNDEVVLRIRLEGTLSQQPGLYWRGVALDTFDGISWRRSTSSREAYVKDVGDLIRIGFASGQHNLSIQTVYLEPLDTNVLFGLSRIVAVQTSLPVIFKDSEGDISSNRFSERITYRVFSDTGMPADGLLRSDTQKYSPGASRFLEIPRDIDPRISQLATQIVAGHSNRFDSAKAVEQYLQSRFGYTLEMKAGGDDPLSDFLFNVREGHCEYFATAMAIMLRTQGIATRVVNGFHQGDYNETAGMYVVRQRNAHSWVEVYFPKTDSWIRFDPTPPAGQTAPAASGLMGRVSKYLDAVEALWIQYFVAYDNQGQRSLVRSVRNGVADYQQNVSGFLTHIQAVFRNWWFEVRGDKGSAASASAIGYAVAYVAGSIAALFLTMWLVRKIVKLEVWRRVIDRLRGRRSRSIVEFYDRMQQILTSKGLVRRPHQTPLEFAHEVGMAEAVRVTERYNRVRFGNRGLSAKEADQVANWLKEIETANSWR